MPVVLHFENSPELSALTQNPVASHAASAIEI